GPVVPGAGGAGHGRDPLAAAAGCRRVPGASGGPVPGGCAPGTVLAGRGDRAGGQDTGPGVAGEEPVAPPGQEDAEGEAAGAGASGGLMSGGAEARGCVRLGGPPLARSAWPGLCGTSGGTATGAVPLAHVRASVLADSWLVAGGGSGEPAPVACASSPASCPGSSIGGH